MTDPAVLSPSDPGPTTDDATLSSWRPSGAAPTPSRLAALAAELSGTLVVPGGAGWDQARRAWNLTADQHPAVVVVAADATDVAATVRHAADGGWRVALQSTGHGAATLNLDDTILVRTGDLRGVSLDPSARRVRVGAGEPVGEVVAAVAPHGLAFLAGSAPGVGVVGYTLGGGIGWLSRRYGLACNSVVGAEVVTSDGQLRRVDRDREPDLFWALRGGGGAFAAVTALDIGLEPVEQVHGGALLWPLERAEVVLEAWRAWTIELPASVTSIARLLRYPPLPTLPPDLRGRAFVRIEAVFLQGQDDTERWLEPLRRLRPEFDTVTATSLPSLGALHGDPEQPLPALTDHRLLTELPPDAVTAALEIAGPGVDTPLLSFDLRHLGGALATGAPDHGVLDRIPAGYAAFAVALAMGPGTEPIGSAMAAMRARLEPWDAGSEYLNFADRPVDASRLFASDRFERLRQVKATYDPEDRFVSNHPITPRG